METKKGYIGRSAYRLFTRKNNPIRPDIAKQTDLLSILLADRQSAESIMEYAVGFMDPRYDPKLGIHTGIDLNNPAGGDSDLGQPVHAITDGRVEAVLKNVGPSWGNLVVIWHPGPGVWSRYGHLDKVFVQRCQIVTAGQVIGTVGKGFNNRWLAHLHLDIFKKRPQAWDDWPMHDRARLLEH